MPLSLKETSGMSASAQDGKDLVRIVKFHGINVESQHSQGFCSKNLYGSRFSRQVKIITSRRKTFLYTPVYKKHAQHRNSAGSQPASDSLSLHGLKQLIFSSEADPLLSPGTAKEYKVMIISQLGWSEVKPWRGREKLTDCLPPMLPW